jgi:hypothetical protein
MASFSLCVTPRTTTRLALNGAGCSDRWLAPWFPTFGDIPFISAFDVDLARYCTVLHIILFLMELSSCCACCAFTCFPWLVALHGGLKLVLVLTLAHYLIFLHTHILISPTVLTTSSLCCGVIMPPARHERARTEVSTTSGMGQLQREFFWPIFL